MQNTQQQYSNGESKAALLSLTAKAVEMVKSSIAEEGLEGHGLRIAVQGGGCSGLQYSLDFENIERPGDSILNCDGLTVYVDLASASYLQGTEIDYITGIQGSGFKFNNPNARRTCSCSSSCT